MTLVSERRWANANLRDAVPTLHWFRFSLGTMFVCFTIASILVGGWTSYQLAWIRQRRALAAEGGQLWELTGNYATGVTSDDLPPLGSTLPQRLLALFGESAASQVHVFYVRDPTEVERDGYLYAIPPTDYPKIQRARRLFPEAVVVAVFIQPEHLRDDIFGDQTDVVEALLSE